MNWDVFIEVWDSFMDFMDRVVQWLQYVFKVTDEWPPVDYPDFEGEQA